MLLYFILFLVVSSVAALNINDKCPDENEEPGIFNKYCEKKKYELIKELSCVCKWFYFKNQDGKCVIPSECESNTTTTTTTTTGPPSPTCDPMKEPISCPKGYELYLVPCKRHYGYDGYDGKKCVACKKTSYEKYPYGK